MPVARYFLFVGGVLLALLLAIDAFVPQQAVVAGQAAASVNRTVVRIRSDQKPLERVVYDTSLPTIVPPPTITAQAVAPPVRAVAPASPLADAAAQARVRETFAQFVPEEAKKPEPQVQRKRKISKSRPAPPMQIAQSPRMRVAQQSHYGFFGGSNWNSTW